MCTGAILLYRIPRVVIGENVNFKGDEDLLRERGVEVIILDDPSCKELMAAFIRERPEVRTSILSALSTFMTCLYATSALVHRSGSKILESQSRLESGTLVGLSVLGPDRGPCCFRNASPCNPNNAKQRILTA